MLTAPGLLLLTVVAVNAVIVAATAAKASSIRPRYLCGAMILVQRCFAVLNLYMSLFTYTLSFCRSVYSPPNMTISEDF